MAANSSRVIVTYLDRKWSVAGELDGYAQYPEDVEVIVVALRALGLRSEALDVGRTPGLLEESVQAGDILFNYVERVSDPQGEESWYVPDVAAKLGVRCLGPSSRTLALVTDKGATKRRCETLVTTARGVFVGRPSSIGSISLDTLRPPLIVKPNFEAGSRGVSDEFVLESISDVRVKVAEQLLRFPQGVLIEEFVAGEDVTVAFLQSGGSYSCLPPVLYRPGRLTESRRRMYDYAAKNAPHAREVQLRGEHAECPAALPRSVIAEIEAATVRTAAALGVPAFGRVDFRLSEGGPCFLEINALPDLDPTGGFAIACSAAGQSLDVVLRSILEAHGMSVSDPELSPHASWT